jgi:hypothetical protein
VFHVFDCRVRRRSRKDRRRFLHTATAPEVDLRTPDADYTRKGLLTVSIRLHHGQPGTPNKAASGFFSTSSETAG